MATLKKKPLFNPDGDVEVYKTPYDWRQYDKPKRF